MLERQVAHISMRGEMPYLPSMSESTRQLPSAGSCRFKAQLVCTANSRTPDRVRMRRVHLRASLTQGGLSLLLFSRFFCSLLRCLLGGFLLGRWVAALLADTTAAGSWFCCLFSDWGHTILLVEHRRSIRTLGETSSAT